MADVPGQYVATLVVNDGASNSKPSKVTVTALPAGALTAGQAVVASLNTGVCAGFTGCAPTVLSDFILTANRCTITKVGSTVTLSRPGMEPISADFDGDVVDRASLSGNSLVIALRGKVVTDQLNISINKDTGAVALATGSATADGVTRTIDCRIVPTSAFPETLAMASISSAEDLFKALDPRDCKGVADGLSFSSCPASTAPDFSIKVGTCTLSKSGDIMTVTKAGSSPISAKLNGDLLDGMGEGFHSSGFALGYLTFGAGDLDPATGSQQSLSIRFTMATKLANVIAFDFGKAVSNQIVC